jgi:ATP-dependent Clp protease ATP-binding subunit ClpA
MTTPETLPYSTRLRVAMALARGIAVARGDVELAPLHAALGILREGENAAVAALDHASVPLRKVRRDLELALGEPKQPRPDEVALPLTDGERRLMQEARSQALLSGDPFVGPHHVLLAILCDATSQATQVFLGYGFNHEAALTHLDAITVKHEHPPGSPPHAAS